MKVLALKLFTMITLFFALSSCQHETKDYNLYSIEKEILTNPTNAYHRLDSVGKEIENAPDSTQMFFQILVCRAKDKCYIKHKNDSAMQKVVKYYKAHNDNEHLMQAYYCMGCIYRDLQKPDKALDYLHKALDCSEHSKKYELIARIYSQMGQLQQDGCADNYALDSYRKAYINFKRANEVKTLPFAMVDLANAYRMLNDSIHAIYYFNLAKKEVLKEKEPKLLCKIYNARILFFLNCKDYNSVEKEYQESCRLMDFEDINQPLFYYIKSKIELRNGDIKSATDNALKSTEDVIIDNRYYAYKLLTDIYMKKKDNEEALKYSIKAVNTLDTMYETYNGESIKRMQYMYNYEKSQKENAQLSIKSLETQRYLFIVFILFLVAAIFIILLFARNRKRRTQIDNMMKEIERKNAESEKQIKANEKMIEQMKETNEELTQLQIKLLKEKNERIKREMAEKETAWTKLWQSDVYKHIHSTINNGELTCPYGKMNENVEQLKRTIDMIFNNFGTRLKRYYPQISLTQMNICYLIKADFTLSEIAVIMAKTKSAVTNARNKMKKNCFDSKITLEEMD